MKPEPVPTSPQYRIERQETAAAGRSSRAGASSGRLGWLTLTVLLSLGAGMVGSLWSLALPNPQAEADVPLLPEITTKSISSTLVATLQQRVGAAIIPLLTNGTVINNFSGLAIAVSNDGWLLTVPAVGESTSELVAQVADKNQPLEKILFDSYTGLNFVKVTAGNLPIVDLRSQPIQLAEPVIIVSQSAQGDPLVSLAYIQAIAPLPDDVRTTAANTIAYQMDHTPLAVAAGSPVFDYDGKVIGLYRDNNIVVPIRTVEQRLTTLLETGALPTRNLEITYTVTEAGATVLSSSTTTLKPDDLILEVNGQAVNRDEDLSWTLMEEEVDSPIDVWLKRDGKRQLVKLIVE